MPKSKQNLLVLVLYEKYSTTVQHTTFTDFHSKSSTNINHICYLQAS